MSTTTFVKQVVPADGSIGATRITIYSDTADTTPTMMSKDSGNNVRVMANIPGRDNIYDIGSTTYYWKDAYLKGNLYMAAAASRIVPGTTSFSIRNNANGADNLLVSDAGAVTVGAGLTVTAGLLAASLSISSANSGIIAGATSFVIRDSTDTNTNLQITDAGVITVRAGLVVTAGGLTVTAGNIYHGDTSNANSTLGLTLNQGAADNEILSLKSSDIAHGVTSVTETDTYGLFKKNSTTSGGLRVDSISNGVTTSMHLVAIASGANTAKTSAALAPIYLEALLSSGANTTAMSADGNLLIVHNGSATQLIVDSEGDLYYNGAAAAYDAYDDIALVRGLDLLKPNAIRTEFDAWIKTKKEDLVEAGIIGADGPNGEPGLLSMTGLQRLHNGTLWQLAKRIMQLEAQVGQLTLAGANSQEAS